MGEKNQIVESLKRAGSSAFDVVKQAGSSLKDAAESTRQSEAYAEAKEDLQGAYNEVREGISKAYHSARGRDESAADGSAAEGKRKDKPASAHASTPGAAYGASSEEDIVEGEVISTDEDGGAAQPPR